MPNTTASSDHLPRDVERARKLVMRFGWNTASYQILNKGILLWFSEQFEAVIGYQKYGNFRIIAGAPICAKDDLPVVLQEFESQTQNEHKRTCYFCAGERLATLIANGKPANYILLGAEPVWNPSEWSSIIQSKPSLRAQIFRAKNKGLRVELWDNDKAANSTILKECLRQWLETRGLPPLHFLIESQTLERLCDRKVFVAELNGVPVGFVVLSPIPNRNGWLVEQNIRGTCAPNGTIEMLLTFAAGYVAKCGADFFTLGLSPLSQRANMPAIHPFWLSFLLGWLRAHGKRFYNFDGLDTFKAKFQPEYWEPIYAITNEKRINIRTLYAIAGAFAGMSPVKLCVMAIWRAVHIEVFNLTSKLRKIFGKR
ncbi:MAG: DUF2156 domain-containing protein [Bacteroidetes bacterium]|nr:DUF2156 domain-containing protein [Bacteroidota bacterium]